MGIFNWAITKSGRMVGYQRIKEDTKFLLDIPKQYAKGIEESVPDKPLEKLSKEVLDIKKRNRIEKLIKKNHLNLNSTEELFLKSFSRSILSQIFF